MSATTPQEIPFGLLLRLFPPLRALTRPAPCTGSTPPAPSVPTTVAHRIRIPRTSGRVRRCGRTPRAPAVTRLKKLQTKLSFFELKINKALKKLKMMQFSLKKPASPAAVFIFFSLSKKKELRLLLVRDNTRVGRWDGAGTWAVLLLNGLWYNLSARSEA